MSNWYSAFRLYLSALLHMCRQSSHRSKWIRPPIKEVFAGGVTVPLFTLLFELNNNTSVLERDMAGVMAFNVLDAYGLFNVA